MAYHWNSLTSASCFIVGGISRMALTMSPRVWRQPGGLRRMASISDALSGCSFVVFRVHSTDVIENTAPIMKAAMTICGIWLPLTASLFIPSSTSSDGVR